MANISKPGKLNLLWASGGDILDPGDTKYQTGWSVEVPPRQWENYIQNKQDQAIAHINQHGIAVWDADTEYQANTSYTQGQTNGTIYRAKVTHSGQNPELDTLNTYWDIAFAAAGDFYTKAEVDDDFLAKDQNLGDIPNATTARTNLNVYSKAETYTKTEVDNKTTVASTAQAQALSSNTVLMTPARTKDAFNASGLPPLFGVRAWGCISGGSSSLPASIKAAGNILSVTRSTTGIVRVTFEQNMPDENFAVVITGVSTSTGSQTEMDGITYYDKTVGGFTLESFGNATSRADFFDISFIVVR
jgi:hypothetical protein